MFLYGLIKQWGGQFVEKLLLVLKASPDLRKKFDLFRYKNLFCRSEIFEFQMWTEREIFLRQILLVSPICAYPMRKFSHLEEKGVCENHTKVRFPGNAKIFSCPEGEVQVCWSIAHRKRNMIWKARNRSKAILCLCLPRYWRFNKYMALGKM